MSVYKIKRVVAAAAQNLNSKMVSLVRNHYHGMIMMIMT